MSSGSSSPSSPIPWLLGERQTPEGGDSMKRFVGTKEGQVWIAGHVPELERPPPPIHWHPLPSTPSSLDKELNVFQPVRKELKGALV